MPMKLMIRLTNMLQLGVNTKNQDYALRFLGRGWDFLPISHDDGSIVDSLRQRSVAAGLAVVGPSLQYGELLVEIPVQGKEDR